MSCESYVICMCLAYLAPWVQHPPLLYNSERLPQKDFCYIAREPIYPVQLAHIVMIHYL